MTDFSQPIALTSKQTLYLSIEDTLENPMQVPSMADCLQ